MKVVLAKSLMCKKNVPQRMILRKDAHIAGYSG